MVMAPLADVSGLWRRSWRLHRRVDRPGRADVDHRHRRAAPVQFGVGRAICRQIGRSMNPTGPARCCASIGGDAAEPLAVLTDVRNGAIEIGIVTSRTGSTHAYNASGSGANSWMRFDNLANPVLLHGEPFTVVARRDAGIARLDDLAGKRVNIGNPGSDQRAIMEMVMQANGLDRDSVSVLADELNRPRTIPGLVPQPGTGDGRHGRASRCPAVGQDHGAVRRQAGRAVSGPKSTSSSANPWLAHTEIPGAGAMKIGMDLQRQDLRRQGDRDQFGGYRR